MRISLPLLALLLVGCSGVEPDFIYTPQQAETVNKQIEELTAKPVQKYLAGADLTEKDAADLEKALPMIDQLIQFNPISINTYALKGKIHLALGDSNSAKVTFLDGIAKSKPVDDALDNLIRSELYIDLAAIHIAENDLKSAENSLNSAISLSDDSAQAHVLLGRVYQRTNRLELAKEEALKALLINADYEPARVFYREIIASPKASP